MLRESGYDFNTLSTALNCFNLDNDLKDYNFCDIYRAAAPFVMWMAKTRLYLEEKPQFIIIHNMLETHTPFYSGDMQSIWIPTKEEQKSTNKKFNKIRKSRYEYLEKNMKKFQKKFE